MKDLYVDGINVKQFRNVVNSNFLKLSFDLSSLDNCKLHFILTGFCELRSEIGQIEHIPHHKNFNGPLSEE